MRRARGRWRHGSRAPTPRTHLFPHSFIHSLNLVRHPSCRTPSCPPQPRHVRTHPPHSAEFLFCVKVGHAAALCLPFQAGQHRHLEATPGMRVGATTEVNTHCAAPLRLSFQALERQRANRCVLKHVQRTQAGAATYAQPPPPEQLQCDPPAGTAASCPALRAPQPAEQGCGGWTGEAGGWVCGIDGQAGRQAEAAKGCRPVDIKSQWKSHPSGSQVPGPTQGATWHPPAPPAPALDRMRTPNLAALCTSVTLPAGRPPNRASSRGPSEVRRCSGCAAAVRSSANAWEAGRGEKEQTECPWGQGLSGRPARQQAARQQAARQAWGEGSGRLVKARRPAASGCMPSSG